MNPLRAVKRAIVVAIVTVVWMTMRKHQGNRLPTVR